LRRSGGSRSRKWARIGGFVLVLLLIVLVVLVVGVVAAFAILAPVPTASSVDSDHFAPATFPCRDTIPPWGHMSER